jgi:hypothetical protein
MNLLVVENVLKYPNEYVSDIHLHGFEDVADGEYIFRNIQIRGNNDDFAKLVSELFPDYEIAFNFVRKSPLNQEEPNFIHSDEMMGEITCILYLNELSPSEDGTTMYDNDKNPLAKVYSKYNRMVAFDSNVLHSRNLFENFGEGQSARLIQVVFLKAKQ